MENKINLILRYLSKTDLAKFLDICRRTLYNHIRDNYWKDYQKEKIEFIYNELSINSNIEKAKIKGGKLIITIRKESSVRVYNCEVIK